LLGEEFRRAGYKGRHRRDLAKEIASSVVSHGISPSSLFFDEKQTSPNKLSPSEWRLLQSQAHFALNLTNVASTTQPALSGRENAGIPRAH
jgi:hypothetical protein